MAANHVLVLNLVSCIYMFLTKRATKQNNIGKAIQQLKYVSLQQLIASPLS